jgi:hypothetical protein
VYHPVGAPGLDHFEIKCGFLRKLDQIFVSVFERKDVNDLLSR